MNEKPCLKIQGGQSLRNNTKINHGPVYTHAFTGVYTHTHAHTIAYIDAEQAEN